MGHSNSIQTYHTSDKSPCPRTLRQTSIDRKRRHSKSSRSRRSPRHPTASPTSEPKTTAAITTAAAAAATTTMSHQEENHHHHHQQQHDDASSSTTSTSDQSSAESHTSSSTSTTGISVAGGNMHDDNCHFAYSAELRMVDNLVSLLAQNARQSNQNQGPSSSSSQ